MMLRKENLTELKDSDLHHYGHLMNLDDNIEGVSDIVNHYQEMTPEELETALVALVINVR